MKYPSALWIFTLYIIKKIARFIGLLLFLCINAKTPHYFRGVRFLIQKFTYATISAIAL